MTALMMQLRTCICHHIRRKLWQAYLQHQAPFKIGYVHVRAGVSRVVHLETQWRRMPCSSRKGTRRIWACCVPLMCSVRWSHDVPCASGMRRVMTNMRGWMSPVSPCC